MSLTALEKESDSSLIFIDVATVVGSCLYKWLVLLFLCCVVELSSISVFGSCLTEPLAYRFDVLARSSMNKNNY
jgi:hypothetical protein